MTSDAAEQTAPANLLEEAKYLLRWLLAVCGTPCALIAEAWLSPGERREIGFWLRPVEGLVRRLLVVEAAKIARNPRLAKEKKCKAVRRPAPRAPFCRVALPDPDDSTTWPVRFSMFPLPAAARPAAAGVPEHLLPKIRNLDSRADVLAMERLALDAARHRERFRKSAAEDTPPPPAARRPKASRAAGNPWRLAKRIEAVKRVLENPKPYARRLARRLRKDPARIAKACRPPPQRRPGERPRYGEGLLRHASEHALSALAPFDTS